jgi:uncharacterized membrane protein
MLISAIRYSFSMLAILAGYAVLNLTDAPQSQAASSRSCGTQEKADVSLIPAQQEKIRNIASASHNDAATAGASRGRVSTNEQSWKAPTSFARCAKKES